MYFRADVLTHLTTPSIRTATSATTALGQMGEIFYVDVDSSAILLKISQRKVEGRRGRGKSRVSYIDQIKDKVIVVVIQGVPRKSLQQRSLQGASYIDKSIALR